jgi:hypothetical protein
MARLTVIRRGDKVSSLVATLENCAGKIGEAFRRLTEPYLQPGEKVPDMALAALLLGRVISDLFLALLRHDRDDFDERANDLAPRAEVQGLAETLHAKLVELRQVAAVAFGGAYGLTLVPIEGTTARTPFQVYRQAEHTMDRLVLGHEDPPEVRVRGLSADLSEMAQDLEPHVAALGAALGVTAAERTRASATAEDKRRMMREFNYVFSHGRNVVKGLLFLAGLEKAARELPALGHYPGGKRRRSGPRPGSRPAGPPLAPPKRSASALDAVGAPPRD